MQTDNQSLSIIISNKNSNVEIKIWYSFIESFKQKKIYKPWTRNVLADALYRTKITNITNSTLEKTQQSNLDQGTQHSA